jgi:hypothetical protein
MAKQDILNNIRSAYQNKTDIVFPMSTMPPDITTEDIANEIQSLTGRNVRDQINSAKASGLDFRIPFSREDKTQMGEGRATGMREKYPSEKLFGPITEGAAQVAGGISKLGRMAGPAGAAVGMATAGAIGGGLEMGRQATQLAFDEPIAPKSLGESAKRIGGRALTSATTEGVTRGLFGAAGKVFSKADLTPAQREISAIADKYKVPLSVADIKQTKLASMLESMSEKTFLSGNIIQTFRKGQIAAFKNAADDLVQRSGGKVDRETAGNMVLEAFNASAEVAKKKTNALYDAARSSIIDPAKKNMNNTAIKQKAREMLAQEELVAKNIQSPIVPLLKDIAQKKSIYDNIDASDALSSKLKEFIRDEANKVGKVGAGQRTTPLGRKYAQLLHSLEKDHDAYYSDVNPGAKGLYDLAKASAKNEKHLYANKNILKLVNQNPEKIVDSVIKNNNVTVIKGLKAAIGENNFKPVKQKFIQDLVESSSTAEGGAMPKFLPSAMVNKLGKYEPETLNAILSKEEQKEIGEIAKLASALETAERVAGNPSGTAQIGSAMAFLPQILVNPGIPLVGIGVPTLIAKMMTTSTGRKIMIDGLKAPPGSPEVSKALIRFGNYAMLNKFNQDDRREKK